MSHRAKTTAKVDGRRERRERCLYCREAYVRKHGQFTDQVHRCPGERCPVHTRRHRDGTFHWPRYKDNCKRCGFAQLNRDLRRRMYDGRGRRRTPCRRCGYIGGYHTIAGWHCTYIEMLTRGHIPVGRYWHVLGRVPVGTVGYGTNWRTKVRLTAPRWAVLIAQAVREFPSARERRALITWAQSCSEGRQTLLGALTRSRLAILALQGEDVRNEDEWIAQ